MLEAGQGEAGEVMSDNLATALATADDLQDARHVFVFHDVRKRTGRPCPPLPFDWHRKNTVGVTVGKNVHRARCWTIMAVMFGYQPYAASRKNTVVGARLMKARK